ncbi:calcineurin-like phosphoesterase family protein [Acidomonas methanolica]|nr:calcineurin-like phosphoesterase family protein [Acidomonas methanolica]
MNRIRALDQILPLVARRPTVAAPDLPVVAAARGLRVVGDVHGDLAAFEHAVATERFIIQLGDLVDHGPDSAGALRLMIDLMDDGRGLFILGNHDRKLGRALAGHRLRRDPPLEATLRQLSSPLQAGLRERALDALISAPAWLTLGSLVFVHGGFHTGMLIEEPPPGLGPITPLLARALFGETTGKMQSDGYPERKLRWIDHIPAGHVVYCGHDRRSTDGRPWIRAGRNGGRAVFTDLGAGKGGHLAWVDIDPA